MRRLIALALATAFVVVVSPAPLVLAQTPGQTGGVAGNAVDAAKNPLPNHTVRLRNAVTKDIAATTTSATNGTFSLSGITPGNYVIEIVDALGNVVGTSTSIAVTAGTVATITVTASALAAAAAAGAAGGAGLFGLGIAGTVIAGAAVVGIAVAIATQSDKSPSR